MYAWLIYFAVCLKLTQLCKSTTFQQVFFFSRNVKREALMEAEKSGWLERVFTSERWGDPWSAVVTSVTETA